MNEQQSALERSRPLCGAEGIREAIKLLRETVIEDRKQIVLRVGFALALVAFTFKDLHMGAAAVPATTVLLVAISFLCLLSAAAIYLRHYHKAIDVVYELSRRLAYSDLGADDLEVPNTYWMRRQTWWIVGSTLFYAGCLLYAAALLAILL